MTLREKIQMALGVRALNRPAFYANPGGLRFELSTGGSAVQQFLVAMRKAEMICSEVFEAEEELTACLSIYIGLSGFEARNALRQLRRTGVRIPANRCVWKDPDGDVDSASLVHVAFSVKKELIASLLWCALSVDLDIRPCPRLDAMRLMSLSKRVLVHPYDDRGMDVVGNNHPLLSNLYVKFKPYLLDHDRLAMSACFEGR